MGQNSIGKINNLMLQQFRDEFRTAVSGLEEKYGIILSTGTIRFTPSKASCKLEITLNPKSQAILEDVEKKQFEAICEMYGLEASDYNRVFHVRNHSYRLKAIKESSRTDRIYIAEDLYNGKRYVFSKFALDFVKSPLTGFAYSGSKEF